MLKKKTLAFCLIALKIKMWKIQEIVVLLKRNLCILKFILF